MSKTKILCLHGAQLSADARGVLIELMRHIADFSSRSSGCNLVRAIPSTLFGSHPATDLPRAPYTYRLEKEENCTFHFVNGPLPTASHESVASFYDGQCYRYFHWAPSPTPFALSQVADACAFLRRVIEDEGPFDGVVGFSQGAVMALALALEHEEQRPEAPPPFRFAVLFSCPYLPYPGGDRDNAEWGTTAVPSLHVAGRNDDEWFEASRTVLHENCVDGTASLVVHDGGHAVPKDRETVERVGREISKFVRENRGS